MKRLLAALGASARLWFDAHDAVWSLPPPPPDGVRHRCVVPPSWVTDDDLVRLRKAGLL